MRSPPVLQWNPGPAKQQVMDKELKSVLERIAGALERLAPAPPPAPDFAEARLFRHDPVSGVFVPAPDYSLPVEALIGVFDKIGVKRNVAYCASKAAVGAITQRPRRTHRSY